VPVVLAAAVHLRPLSSGVLAALLAARADGFTGSLQAQL
jgi:hypothetical protein